MLMSVLWICAGTFANAAGRWVLKLVVGLSVAAEFIASIGLGLVLIFVYRVNPISVLWDTMGTGDISTLNWWGIAFLGALAYFGWTFVGFESPGAVAEEVKNPEKAVPKAIWGSLAFVGAVCLFTNIAWLLAIPDFAAVMTGGVADPMVGALEYHLGDFITRPILVIIAVGFSASMMACQTSGSRTIFSFARDRMIPMHTWLRRLQGEGRIPVNAILATAVLALALLLANLITDKVYATLLLFGSCGFYISFTFPVAASVVARLRGRFTPSETWNLRGLGGTISGVALAWLIFETVNIAWPRGGEGIPWYTQWGTFGLVSIVAVMGLIVFFIVARDRSVFAAEVCASGERASSSGCSRDTEE
jgi:amino acid transporter